MADPGKSQIGIRHHQGLAAFDALRIGRRHYDSTGPGILKILAVGGIGEKRQGSRAGVLQGGKTCNHYRRVSLYFRLQENSQLFQRVLFPGLHKKPLHITADVTYLYM